MSRQKTLRAIGVVDVATAQAGKIRVFHDYCEGLRGIEAFSHLLVLYWLHQRDSEKDRRVLLVFPRRHSVNVETGVFACRSPSRPNPIGLCVVELVHRNGCTLTVNWLDAFEGSPIVDIKPYLPRADAIPTARTPAWTNNGPST